MAEQKGYPVETIAKVFMLTPRRVQQLANEGVIVKTGRGQYNLVESFQGYIKYLNAQIPNKALQPDSANARLDSEAERAKLLREKAQMARYERLEYEGRLIPADEVKRDAYSAALSVRRAVMAVPDRAAPRLTETNNQREVRSLLRRELTDALIDVAQVIREGGALPLFSDPDADCAHWAWAGGI